MCPMSFKDSCAESMRDHNRRAGIQAEGGYVPYKTMDEIARFREAHRESKQKDENPRHGHWIDGKFIDFNSPEPQENK